MRITILTDITTRKEITFKSITEATDFINEEFGTTLKVATIKNTIMRGNLIKDKYLGKLEGSPVAYKRKPKRDKYCCDKFVTKDGWKFARFAVSPRVVVAEKRIKWIDRHKIYKLGRWLDKQGFRLFVRVEKPENEFHFKRITNTFEIYSLVRKKLTFEEHVKMMLPVLNSKQVLEGEF